MEHGLAGAVSVCRGGCRCVGVCVGVGVGVLVCVRVRVRVRVPVPVRVRVRVRMYIFTRMYFVQAYRDNSRFMSCSDRIYRTRSSFVAHKEKWGSW